MSTAKDRSVRLDAMADHLAATVFADGCQQMDRALETIEDVGLVIATHLERLVVLVTANLTRCHDHSREMFGCEISSTISPARLSFASIATSACANTPTSRPSSTTGSRRTR